MTENFDPEYLAFIQKRFDALEAMWDKLASCRCVSDDKTVKFVAASPGTSIAYTQLVETAEAIELDTFWVPVSTVEVHEEGFLTLKEGFLDRPMGRWLLELGNARLGIWFAYQMTPFNPGMLKKITLVGMHAGGKAAEPPPQVLAMVQRVMGYTPAAKVVADKQNGYLYIEEEQSAAALRIRTQTA